MFFDRSISSLTRIYAEYARMSHVDFTRTQTRGRTVSP
ncbi:hypothetical protein AKJ09_06244 [Labilithrix luteola]|uniref:Uncharacterized protein n=1 Tax=Labilithrix luteola TaxID=1391654 RepID=A0A0K1Q1B5_9BACT|nr:hypothetical protein AKJ09_06244 [Labilithrix luteola]